MPERTRHFVIGTAGHIDHGKTSMVIQLTGRDTDWLKEEKERGMTIDLGFAFLGDNITIIDVPGHEKFIRNMVAGVSTIDLVLLVIAADDGVMPQTREHLDILNLLQIKNGIIVITKTDIVESDWTELVVDDIQDLVNDTFLKDAPIIKISNESGEGIPVLKSEIMNTLKKVAAKKDKGVFRLPIDRVFSMKGFGTVVAGTVLSGSLTTEQPVELLPHGITARVRGLEIHEQKVERVNIGERAAVNIAGVEKETIGRGDVLAEPDFFKPTRYFDAKFYLLKSSPKKLRHNARIRVHVGTNEVIGRISVLDRDEIEPGEMTYVQFRLEKPVVADFDDRFVVRQYSPVYTIGGGKILNAHPKRHKRFSKEIIEQFEMLDQGDSARMIEQFLLDRKFSKFALQEICQQLSISESDAERYVEELVSNGQIHPMVEKSQTVYLHQQHYSEIRGRIMGALQEYHSTNPSKRGMSKTELKVAVGRKIDPEIINKIMEDLNRENEVKFIDSKVALASHEPQFSEKEKQVLDQVRELFIHEKFATPNPSETADKLNLSQQEVDYAINVLLDSYELVKLEDGIYFHIENIREAEQRIRKFFENNNELTVSDCRQLFNNSRKYNVPLLNYFDKTGLTVRQQDVRVLNRS
ncbi:selenocysteine-specific translation elongation factor [candidate division KSB1 bacterium]|nr:selenocysteine-specific translation elongation factor [candidate division KSB1 bacterium]